MENIIETWVWETLVAWAIVTMLSLIYLVRHERRFVQYQASTSPGRLLLSLVVVPVAFFLLCKRLRH